MPRVQTIFAFMTVSSWKFRMHSAASVPSVLRCNKTGYHAYEKYVIARRTRLRVLKRLHVGTDGFKEKLRTKCAATVLQGSMLILVSCTSRLRQILIYNVSWFRFPIIICWLRHFARRIYLGIKSLSAVQHAWKIFSPIFVRNIEWNVY